MEPKFGPLGAITYARTYARPTKSGIETFEQTISRVLEASNEQLGCNFGPDELAELRQYMFDMKCSVAGRFLWQLGTQTVDKLGLLSLQNCATTVVNEPIKPFTWAMDALMLGCGVGYNIQREYVYELPKVSRARIVRKDENDADFIIPDSREGWVELLRKTLESHFITGKGFSFSTACIRGAGTPIKGFGGTASGPEPLAWGILQITEVLNKRAGKKLRPIDALDVMNIIGYIVVSGNVRRCLPEGALVHTRQGLIPIQNIEVGMEALTTVGYKNIKSVFKQGKQAMLTLKTKDGVFKCTPNHKMARLTSPTQYEWIEAGQLTLGDRLVTARQAIQGQHTKLPAWEYTKSKHSTTCKDLSIPELTSDVAWLLGLMQADGYVYPNFENNGFNAYINIVVGIDELDIANKAAKILQKFGSELHIRVVKRKGEQAYMVHCQSKQLAWYFAQHLKQAKQLLTVPVYILEGTQEIRESFLAGVLDGDGAINNRPIHLVTSVYKPWVEQLQVLAYSCGIDLRIKGDGKELPSRAGWQPLYHLCVISTHAKTRVLQFKELMKFKKTEVQYSQNTNGYPSDWIQDAGIRHKAGLYQAKQLTADRYEELYQTSLPFAPSELIEIIYTNEEYETYDIEVDDQHEFFCGGYLTHNSAQLCIGDYDDLEYLQAKNWSAGNIPNWRAMSNNSVVCNDVTKLPQQFWDTYAGGSEPYGLINLKLARQIGRTGDTEYPDPNIIGFNPCAEQSLAAYESCCLSEVFLPNVESEDELERIVSYMYRINKHSLALDCHHPETQQIVHKNMRMGIGVTGYLQATEDQRGWLKYVYEYLRGYDKRYSEAHDFPTSIKLTTVKPSGTLSLLAGVTSGCHPAYSPYYVRRIRMAANSDLVDVCRKHGYPVEFVKQFDGSDDHKTVCVSFPCKTPEGTIIASEMTCIDQLEVVKRLQAEWSDNAVSCTIYYKSEELSVIQEYLKKNYNENFKSLSFLLHSEHGFQQAPYEEIDEATYLSMSSKTSLIVLNTHDIVNEELDVLSDCEGGSCPVR